MRRGCAALCGAALAAAAPARDTVSCDVVVVGAGLAGTNAAWRIASAPNPPKVCLLEATDRVGGRTKDYVIPGCKQPQTVELGAQWIAQPEVDADVWDLAVNELNLGIYNGWPWQLFVPAYGPAATVDATTKAALDAVPSASSPQYDAGKMFFGPHVTSSDKKVGACKDRVAAVYDSINQGEPWRTPDAAKLDAMTPLEWLHSVGCNITKEDVINQGLSDLDHPWRIPSVFWMGTTSAGSSGQEVLWQSSALWWLHNVKSNHGPMSMTVDLQRYRIVGGPQQMSQRLVERLRSRGAVVALSSPVVEVRATRQGVTLVTQQGRLYTAQYAVMTGTPVALSVHISWDPPQPAIERMLKASRVGGYNKHYAFFNNGPIWRNNPTLWNAIQQRAVMWPMVYEHQSGLYPQQMGNGTHFIPSGALDNSPATVPADDAGCPNGAGALFSFGWPGNGSTAAARADGWRQVLAGIPGLPEPSSVHGQAWSEEPYVLGAYAAWWTPGAITAAGEQWLESGRVFFAGSEWSPEGAGYMNGAIHNGRRVGSKVLCLLGHSDRCVS
eukprot:TRINITY_DN21381_c0_g1_i1.p1 TRINITY_DN21381_c0_g1~~TRINITY_DN21381_c0_g1_i1.p1  ORF type:complete len:580 (+),score=162.69 TRINITY_DN21381_c0_g1_i1:80-1741(+)